MQHILVIFAILLCREFVCIDGSYFFDDDEDYFDEIPPNGNPEILSTSLAVKAYQGEPVTLPCDVHDLGNFVILWKRDKTLILFAGDLRIIRDERIKSEGTSLHITSVEPKDSGEYTCLIATNPPIELTHTLDVLYPPSVSARPKEASIKEGESVTLICDATGNPAPTITWKHEGRHYDSLEGNSHVIINNAQKNDSGEYECVANNSIGEPASATITVEVISTPIVYPEPRSGLLVVKENEPISIGCEATGDPMPVITWKKPNGVKGIDNNKIMIAEASEEDAGNYECIAKNSLGHSASSVIRVQVLVAPRIQMSHTSLHAREDSSVEITCTVEGEPAPTVTWRKDDGQVIHSNNHIHLRVNGHSHMLIIDHLQEQDFGKYECSASNSLSSVTGSTHLIGTPEIPSFTSKPNSTRETKYTISWKVNSDIPVDEYSLMYRKKADQEEWKIKSVPATDINDEEMFQLVELQPSTEYEAVVKARNKFGWSEQSEVLVFTTKSEENHKEIDSDSSNSTALSFNLSTMLALALSAYIN